MVPKYSSSNRRHLQLPGYFQTIPAPAYPEEDLKKVFELVKEYLAEDGVFIFDLNTVHKYRDLMGECTISENREESSFIWENYFYEDEMVPKYSSSNRRHLQLPGYFQTIPALAYPEEDIKYHSALLPPGALLRSLTFRQNCPLPPYHSLHLPKALSFFQWDIIRQMHRK